MKRLLMQDLIAWKNNPNKKPLVIQGVRQCGKTFLIKDFATQHYPDVAYYRFDKDAKIKEFFEQDLDPQRIIKDLGLARGKKIKPHQTLIIFDEIQDCNKAVTALKYFYEDTPEYPIISAGSLLGVAIKRGASFPVGKVEFLTLYPMNFYEFLLAQNEMLAMELKVCSLNDAVWKTFRNELLEKYRDFNVVGGMPEVVQVWLDTKNIEEVQKKLDEILLGYQKDFVKYAHIKEYPKISAVWQSIPSQLGKENRKFIFSQVKKGWRAKDLEDALMWLIQAGLVYKVDCIQKPNYPISSYADHTFFKLYLSDIGLLRRHADLPSSIVFDDTFAYKEFKGAMAENFVACELKSLYGKIKAKDLYYWTAEGSAKAEVDFIVQDDEKYIIPIEVKSGAAKHARSLTQYCQKFHPEKSVLTSLDEMTKKILPLYAFWKFKEWVKQQ
ncbi:MAG: ATP-binding protein [Nitrososphaerota archaeon]|jgi:predicted AAA+ superfamily ATPase|nr:ATP-binding protein [Nitrososphaerota archaeon]